MGAVLVRAYPMELLLANCKFGVHSGHNTLWDSEAHVALLSPQERRDVGLQHPNLIAKEFTHGRIRPSPQLRHLADCKVPFKGWVLRGGVHRCPLC